ncbi:MAG: DsrE family protein, partial [Plesiomonas shigelloides]
THERWGVLLHQIHNTLRDAQNRVEDVDIQVVAVGTGVIALQQPVAENLGFIDNMRELSRQGVRFWACHNALNALAVAPERLTDFVLVVPAGIVALTQKQQQGYAYIRV